MENLREKIEFIRTLRNFGEKELGLCFGESFRHFASDQFPPQWLYVSERYRIQSLINNFGWPYIGKFQKPETMASLAFDFQQLGYDIYIYTAEAWGGAPCPILPILLEQPRIRQAYVVLHEGLHTTQWHRKSKTPYVIEEPAAIAIADRGIMEFAEYARDKSLFRDLLLLRVFRKKFEQAIKRATLMLEEKYKEVAERAKEKKEAEREKLLSAMRADSIWQDAEETGVTVKDLNRTQEINNAFFLRYGTYYTHLSLVHAAEKRFSTTREAIDFFMSLPKELNESLEQLRRKTRVN